MLLSMLSAMLMILPACHLKFSLYNTSSISHYTISDTNKMLSSVDVFDFDEDSFSFFFFKDYAYQLYPRILLLAE